MQNYLHISECEWCIINSVLEGSIGRKICRAVRWRPRIFHGNHTICQLWVNTRIPSKKFAPSYSIKQASFDALRTAHNDIWDFRKFDLCVTNVAYLFALLMTWRAKLIFFRLTGDASCSRWLVGSVSTVPECITPRTTFVRTARRTNSGKHRLTSGAGVVVGVVAVNNIANITKHVTTTNDDEAKTKFIKYDHLV